MSPPSSIHLVRPESTQIPESSILPQLALIVQEMTYRSQRKWSLPPNACMVIAHLEMHPDICEPAAIARAKQLPRQTITFVLDTLEQKKLAVRRPHPSDRRRKTVHLTARGKKLASGILHDFLQVEQTAVASMDKTSLNSVRRMLEGFGSSINRQNANEFRMLKG